MYMIYMRGVSSWWFLCLCASVHVGQKTACGIVFSFHLKVESRENSVVQIMYASGFIC